MIVLLSKLYVAVACGNPPQNMSHLNAVIQLFLSNVYSILKLPFAASPSADSADGRQFRQPITYMYVSAVAGGGITSKKWTKVTDYWTI